jgi:predicted acylesterase/phospholipase RssA
MFGPVQHNGRWLVDGGVLNNFPVDVVCAMGADRIIGVNTPPSVRLTPQANARRRLSLGALFSPNVNFLDWKMPFLIAESSAHFTIRTVNRQRLALCPPDVLIEVNLPNIGTFVTDRNMEIIQAGYKNAQAVVDDLRALRDKPLPSAWQQRWEQFRRRLRRAWHAYKEPPLFPQTREMKKGRDGMIGKDRSGGSEEGGTM